MKQFLKIGVLSVLVFFISCERNNGSTIEPNLDDDINFFIWKGLTNFYLWQKDVPELTDEYFSSYDQLYTHFRGFTSPETVFESLLFRPTDRFSWIVDDYIALENSFQGINLSNGMEFGAVLYENGSNNIFCYVRYVIPNSDAASKGIARGMLFNTIDGIQLNLNNYQELLFGNATSYTIGLSDFNNGNPISNGNTISLDKFELQENPIAVSKVIEEGSKKIGYLLYNQFARNYDGQLNTVFANFKAENIDEIIIDLRYNPGGFISSATYLGSMITGQFNGQLYSQEIWNDKVMAANASSLFLNNFTNEIRNVDDGVITLQETINNLNFTKAYFIVSNSSASASELVINALSSYIDVRVIGSTTRGKQVGSITIYDSDNARRTGANLNPNHTYAMQPLVLEISNKNGVNYPNGIVPASADFPGISQGEDFSNLGVLGEKSDPLLNAALNYVLTGNKPFNKTSNTYNFDEVFNSKLALPTKDNMFTDFK